MDTEEGIKVSNEAGSIWPKRLAIPEGKPATSQEGVQADTTPAPGQGAQSPAGHEDIVCRPELLRWQGRDT